MKLNVKKFNAFNEQEEPLFVMGYAVEPVNETFFSGLFAKIAGLFKDKEKLTKSVEATVTEAGDKAKMFSPKTYKTGETVMVVLGDGKTASTDFSIAFTKMADLQDGNGLFQIVGTTSPEMLKSLAGSDKEEDLALNNVMAIVTPTSFTKGKPATMKLVKNMIPGGKDYLTKSVFVGAVTELDVEKTLTKIK